MVSIPDWARLARAIGTAGGPISGAKAELYYQQREEETIKAVNQSCSYIVEMYSIVKHILY